MELKPGKLINKVFNTDGCHEAALDDCESAFKEVDSTRSDAEAPKPEKSAEEKITAGTSQYQLATVSGTKISDMSIDNNEPSPKEEDNKPKQKRIYLAPILLDKIIDAGNAETITKWLKLCGAKPKAKTKANRKRSQLKSKIESILSDNDQVPSSLTKAFIQKLYDKDITAELHRLEVPLVKSAKSASDRKLVLADALCHIQNSEDFGNVSLLMNMGESPEDKAIDVNGNCLDQDTEGLKHGQSSKVNDESSSSKTNEAENNLKFKILEDSLLSLQGGFESQKATLDLLLMEDNRNNAKKKCTGTQDLTGKIEMLERKMEELLQHMTALEKR